MPRIKGEEVLSIILFNPSYCAFKYLRVRQKGTRVFQRVGAFEYNEYQMRMHNDFNQLKKK